MSTDNDKYRFELKCNSLACLQNCGLESDRLCWLNDEVINYYMYTIINKACHCSIPRPDEEVLTYCSIIKIRKGYYMCNNCIAIYLLFMHVGDYCMTSSCVVFILFFMNLL